MVGVGLTTAYALLAYCPELGTLSKKKILAIAGLAPRTRQSGSKKMCESIGGGRSRLRRAAYMSALVAIRCDPSIRAYYEGLVKRGKPKKMAIIAVMGKLLIYANPITKRQIDFEKRDILRPDKKAA